MDNTCNIFMMIKQLIMVNKLSEKSLWIKLVVIIDINKTKIKIQNLLLIYGFVMKSSFLNCYTITLLWIDLYAGNVMKQKVFI